MNLSKVTIAIESETSIAVLQWVKIQYKGRIHQSDKSTIELLNVKVDNKRFCSTSLYHISKKDTPREPSTQVVFNLTC